jgi:hypothetical protein
MPRSHSGVPAILTLATAILAAACSDATSPDSVLTRQLQSEHYVFHLSGSDWVDTTWQEAYHDWLLQTLAVGPDRKIDYYKYVDRAQKKSAMGVDGNGIAYPEKWQLHTIWSTDNHEVVHVVVGTMIGMPVPLFTEGMAVAHQVNPVKNDYVPRWGSRAINDIARELWQNGTMPPLADLVQSENRFRSYPESTTYPLSGSFVRYLIDSRGLARMKQFIGASRFNDAANSSLAKFKSAYGEDLEAVWQEWRAALLR